MTITELKQKIQEITDEISELSLDDFAEINKELYDYSYAKYRNNELVLQYGKYYFNLKLFEWFSNYQLTLIYINN